MACSLRLRARVLALLVATFATVIGAATDARAQQDVGEARALFMAGRSAFTEGRYEAALNYFSQSYELSGKPLLLFNIAQCHDRLRNDAKAIETFEAYLSAVPDAENRNEVEARLAILRRAAAEQTPAEPPPVEPTPVEAPAPLAEPTPPERSPEQELPALEPSEPTPIVASDDYAQPDDSDSLPIGPIIVVGAGAAASIAGIVMIAVGSGLASDLQDEVDAAADGGDRLTWDYVQSETSAAEGPLIGGQVLLGVGLAAVASGTLWWVMGGGERPSNASVRVTPLATGVALDGRF